MAKASDSEIIRYARANNYIVVTTDSDFADELALSGAAQPGVIILRFENPSPQTMCQALEMVLMQVPSGELESSIVVVQVGRVRIRALPMSS